MNDYTNTWGKFMENLTSPKEYYELTIDELKKLCYAFYHAIEREMQVADESNEYPIFNSKEYIKEWLKENLKT